ncbi:NADP-dependent oxidoreductase domain-containing protein 1 isoform X1 [Malaclemys terrapin pileata]|uniref:NADP-dependent oxidoreductase domain-containing protein 1 isoform X1 n=2 Tax=Malaclemys terrapin pileata TaxID=2991368 RepID=UPI0023A7FFDE|nr:NADP-dependent oxidoreductase domain-containing protein 1 isoform X1 [Malaclemys terrapin pileata]
MTTSLVWTQLTGFQNRRRPAVENLKLGEKESSRFSCGATMSDIMVNLKSFQSEHAVEESEQPLLCLRSRCKGLMVNACAHAVFFCKLLHAVRQKASGKVSLISSKESMGSEGLKVGIIGGGHIGKQLARALLELSDISAQNIHISTRRPETLSEFQQLGVDCFYDNGQLVAWADIVFLCCLPSHLQHICSGIQAALREPCIVYSLVTAVPLPRLKQLLSYSAILRPQYHCTSRNLENMWGTNGTIIAALQDPIVIQATCPCSPKERIAVTGKWLEAVFYAALNSCMWRHLPHQHALKLLNDVCFPEHCPICTEQKTSCPRFVCGNFVNQTFVSSLTQEDTFPWFDLTTVQMKESPFSQLLARSVLLQNHLTFLYCTSFGVLLAKSGGMASSGLWQQNVFSFCRSRSKYGAGS